MLRLNMWLGLNYIIGAEGQLKGGPLMTIPFTNCHSLHQYSELKSEFLKSTGVESSICDYFGVNNLKQESWVLYTEPLIAVNVFNVYYRISAN